MGLFQPLFVRVPATFPVAGVLLLSAYPSGAGFTVFRPVGLWDKHSAADRTAFQLLIPENLCFQRSDLRQDRPAEPLAADRERNGVGAGVGVPIVKGHTVPVLIVAALPAD